ncbi:cysteine desulfurase [Roseiconus nitratireducens]|uniref:cysteine desulfurase n=1 Tax=Roseiconus nitratireducens TaxID=2605748 RepID=A0A5M6CYH2_9BACT|nr:cysteine desulfurase family protein [Roseiconus nitratireducens]KAA5540251.1 cysteine desulfurase [Roseiconus nitratireducens]
MIYLDNHATTPCDRRVLDRMLPWLTEKFGNPHSTSHEIGREAAQAIDSSLNVMGAILGVAADSILMTSGATESNNLAIDGVCRHPRQKRRNVITTTIEHPAVLDVVDRLEKDGFRVTRVPVHQQGHESAGQVDLAALRDALNEDTALVSVHWANNEIGVIQPLDQIAAMVHEAGALLHSDATQAVGRIPVSLAEVDVDLLSASAHKFYGPKGVGFLTIASGCHPRRVRLKPLIVGGGQQRNLRSGTMAPANVVGCAAAMELACAEIESTAREALSLRDRLWSGLNRSIDELRLNGSSLEPSGRLVGNLNVMLPGIEGEAWMSATPGVAFSSGSACSSVDAKPSHVLTGIGLSESEARRSVRFGVGKFNTRDEIELAIAALVEGFQRVAGSLQ